MNSKKFTLKYLPDKRRQIFQFCLTKCLMHEDIFKLPQVSKDASSLCDANKVQINSDNFDKSDQIEIQQPKKKSKKKVQKNQLNSLRYLMLVITLQSKSQNIMQESDQASLSSLKVDLPNFEEFGIKEQEFTGLFKCEPVYAEAQLGKLLQACKILTLKSYNEMIRKLQDKNPKIRELNCLLRLHEKDLEQGNLKNHQILLWKQFSQGNYNGFLIILRSIFGKKFAFYTPDKFEETQEPKDAGNQFGFYWINGDQLVTVTNSVHSLFMSDDEFFICMDAIIMANDRNYKVYADLDSSDSTGWSDILVGTDGYPTKNEKDHYCIGGGKDEYFKATAIEFYGVKTQT